MLKLEWHDIGFAIVIAVLFSLFYSLFPFSEIYPGTDSAVFIYIGKQMRNGLIPYLDLFDHKGILLFFIEYLGIMISGGATWGIWALEIINLFITAVFILKIAKLFTKHKVAQYLATVIPFLMYTCYITVEGGNVVEEYALPWIAIAFYIVLHYFMTESYKAWEIAVLGIGFMMVFFLRVNMITVWVAFLPVIFVQLLWKKKYQDVFKCILWFLIGCAVVLIPILVYCISTGSLEAMIECYWQFNVGYSDSEGTLFSTLASAWFLLRQSNLFVIFFMLCILMFYKNQIVWLNLWFSFVSIVLVSMSGRKYTHYGIILVPLLIIPACLLADWMVKKIKAACKADDKVSCLQKGNKKKLLTERINGKTVRSIAIVVLVLLAGAKILTYQDMDRRLEASKYISENSNREDNVLVIGNDCRYYLEADRTTTNRFFYQMPPINISSELYEEFWSEVEQDYPDIIVVTGEKESLVMNGSRMKEICSLLDEMTEEGIYASETYDSFFAYKLQ